MYPEKLELNKEKINQLVSLQHKSFFRSEFNFFKSHNGLRENKMHLVIAPTSAGKSTFVRSVLTDLLFRNKDKKILLWLTEETRDEFITEFASTVPEHEVLSNLRIVSEMNTSYDLEEIKNTIEQSIDLHEIDLLIIDNITTSKFYLDKTTREQSEVASWYKWLSTKTATLLIAHSNGNEFNNRLLDENDIRGSKTITNIAQFLYVIQPIRIGSKLVQYVNIIKHRGINLRKGRFFKLHYEPELKAFDYDEVVNFEDVKEMFQLRNQLGR